MQGWDKTYCLQFVEKDFDAIHFFGDKTFEVMEAQYSYSPDNGRYYKMVPLCELCEAHSYLSGRSALYLCCQSSKIYVYLNIILITIIHLAWKA